MSEISTPVLEALDYRDVPSIQSVQVDQQEFAAAKTRDSSFVGDEILAHVIKMVNVYPNFKPPVYILCIQLSWRAKTL